MPPKKRRPGRQVGAGGPENDQAGKRVNFQNKPPSSIRQERHYATAPRNARSDFRCIECTDDSGHTYIQIAVFDGYPERLRRHWITGVVDALPGLAAAIMETHRALTSGKR